MGGGWGVVCVWRRGDGCSVYMEGRDVGVVCSWKGGGWEVVCAWKGGDGG